MRLIAFQMTIFSFLILPLFSESSASVVGLHIFRGIFDHVEISVSDDDGQNTTSLNIWIPVDGMQRMNLRYLERESRKTLLFASQIPKEEIIEKWYRFFRSHVNPYAGIDKRSILSKNCAYASHHVITKILGIQLPQGLYCSWVSLTLWVCQMPSFRIIHNGEDLWKRLTKQLNSNMIYHYNSELKHQISIDDFFHHHNGINSTVTS